MKIEYPCAKCEKNKQCNAMCIEWKEWFRQIWPIVTGKKVGDDGQNAKG